MYRENEVYDKSIKYDVLVNFLKNRLENKEDIPSKDIKEQLKCLGVEIKEKTSQVSENKE
mgnify:CR=1 FL=1|jgi:hypothetical protein